MGYTLTIGEYAPTFEDDGAGYTYIRHDVESAHHDEAPAFGEPTDGQNTRWPSYTTWADFTKLTGLEEMFSSRNDGEYPNRSLLREHPGCFPLSAWHKECVDAAVERLKATYPNALPAMCESIAGGFPEHEANVNSHYARLTWLKYWIDWALANCKRPVFYNS